MIYEIRRRCCELFRLTNLFKGAGDIGTRLIVSAVVTYGICREGFYGRHGQRFPVAVQDGAARRGNQQSHGPGGRARAGVRTVNDTS